MRHREGHADVDDRDSERLMVTQALRPLCESTIARQLTRQRGEEPERVLLSRTPGGLLKALAIHVRPLLPDRDGKHACERRVTVSKMNAVD